MDIFRPIFGVPSRIRSIERFGVGNFSVIQREMKYAWIKSVMDRRSKPESPSVSVIIPAYHEDKYLMATLLSLAEQTEQDAEFLIVCNGEPKGSLTERTAQKAGFTVIHERKGGVARARQAGLEAAKGRIIVTSDADTLHHRQWLEVIVSECGGNPGVVGGFGWLRALSSSLSHQLCIQLHSAWRSLQGRHLFLNASEANSFYLRDAALQVGGYDIKANYAEGSMLFRKLAELGELHCINDARAVVYTSDRRDILDRMRAIAQYALTYDAKKVDYAAVR